MLLQNPNQTAHLLADNCCSHIYEQTGYEGYGQRREEEVALDQAEVHDKEVKMQDTSLYKGNYTKNDR